MVTIRRYVRLAIIFELIKSRRKSETFVTSFTVDGSSEEIDRFDGIRSR